MTKVLVLTTEPLPLTGCATTGAGLRAWGLSQGLAASGLAVTIAAPIEHRSAASASEAYLDVKYFERSYLGKLLTEVNPNIVILQHWGLAADLPALDIPLAIDLAGPHLLERLYWGSKDIQSDLQQKITALRRADFVTCSGYFQRHYFYPYLAMAGFDLRTTDIPVIPFSVPPVNALQRCSSPTISTNAELTFVYGGAFLAWQDPALPIKWLLDEMENAGKGRLLFYGGRHPAFDASAGKFDNLVKQLVTHPRVKIRGWKPFQQLIAEYQSDGHVALDLMARNPERELAFTTRTMVYLYCGLPVIYNNYSEISSIIESGDCGWVVDPGNEVAFRKLVASLLDNPSVLATKSANAVRTAAQFNWYNTIAPLADFCHTQSKVRERDTITLSPHSDTGIILSPPKTRQSEIRQLSKRLAPLVYFLAWPIALYLEFRLRIGSKHLSNQDDSPAGR